MDRFTSAPRLVRLRARGQLTIPQEMRDAMGIDDRTGLNLLRVGKVLILTPEPLERASLAREAERELKKEGLTLKDLIADLEAQRERYLEETSPGD
jgi:bifunctional DNA-binding transcriptional regulator/antitoxin component of YhaV-PrlF toxin-antitoxin module